jgi:hypothetical protein
LQSHLNAATFLLNQKTRDHETGAVEAVGAVDTWLRALLR